MAFNGVSEPAVRTAIVNVFKTVVPDAKVYRRFRWPSQGRDQFYQQYFFGTAGFVHYYAVRRLQRRPLVRGIRPRLLKITDTYGIRGYRSLLDNDVDGQASEELYQEELESIGTALENDFTLGFGPAVQHAGLIIPVDFVDVQFGQLRCHRVELRLEVARANTTC
jgi:hypothetical protein